MYVFIYLFIYLFISPGLEPSMMDGRSARTRAQTYRMSQRNYRIFTRCGILYAACGIESPAVLCPCRCCQCRKLYQLSLVCQCSSICSIYMWFL